MSLQGIAMAERLYRDAVQRGRIPEDVRIPFASLCQEAGEPSDTSTAAIIPGGRSAPESESAVRMSSAGVESLTCKCPAGNSAQRRQASTAAGTPAQSMPEPGTGRSGGRPAQRSVQRPAQRAVQRTAGTGPAQHSGPRPAIGGWLARQCMLLLPNVCHLCSLLPCRNLCRPTEGLSLASVPQLALTIQFQHWCGNQQPESVL